MFKECIRRKYIRIVGQERLFFFVSSFRKSALTKGFDYGNKVRRDIAEKLVVLLPVDKDGSPDWKYMTNYILDTEKKVKKSLKRLLTTV